MSEGQLGISLVVTSLDIGGAERQVALLAKAYHELGHRVEVVSLLSPGAVARQLQATDIAVRTLEMRRGRPNPLALYRLRRHLRAFAPDIVHSHMIHANILTRIARPIRSQFPLVCTAHSTDEGGGWRIVAYRITHNRADLTTNVSDAGVAAFERRGAVPRGGMIALPNGVAVREAPPRCGTRPLRWVCVARLTHVKGLDLLLRAVALRRRDGIAEMLTIVGGGPLRHELEELSKSLGVADLVSFVGEVEDPTPFYDQSDALIVSSRMEGFPMVLLEAAGARLPIVATAVGGISDALAGNRGIIVAPGDAEAIADGMCQLGRMPPHDRDSMAVRWRQFVSEHYGIDVVAPRWISIYRGLIAERAVR